MYEMKDYRAAIDAAQRVVDTYPGAEADPASRVDCGLHMAHSNSPSTSGRNRLTQVLAATPEGDETHAAFVDNLAASIYKQGELANEAQDYRAAADTS
jgi:hypothetical protein